MNVLVENKDVLRHPVEALVLVQFEKEKPGKILECMDSISGGSLLSVLKRGDFTGKLYETAVFYAKGPARRILIVGLGKSSRFDAEKLRGAYAAAARKLRDLNLRSFSTVIDPGAIIDQSVSSSAAAMVEGVMLGLYRFERYKTEKTDRSGPECFSILLKGGEEDRRVRAAVERARIVCEAVCYTRDLVSTPANDMTPGALAEKAMGQRRGHHVRVNVLGAGAMSRLKMNAILSVAKGSHEEPKFIIMEYQGASVPKKPIVLVGKGVTFDSGGISLKPAEKMGEMKSDMAGAAAVIGTIRAVSRMELPIHVIGLIPAAENLPGGGAYRPGDILKSRAGRTIEVVSTDSEGRLLLADALAYASRYRPKAIVDIATLTGACRIALSDIAIGMLGSDDILKETVRSSGYSTGEKVWELPLWEEYEELIKSDVADMKNTGGREGGAITAAAFLKKFVEPYPWVHLDIAGPAWIRKDRPYIPKGASGIGVRLLVDVLRKEAEGKRSGEDETRRR